MATPENSLIPGKKLTAEQAESKRKLLGFSRKQIIRDMSHLAGVKYSRADIHRWFATKPRTGQATVRGPSVALIIYLRMAIREAWRRRCEARDRASQVRSDLKSRALVLIEAANPTQLERFEKRLRLSEDELQAGGARPSRERS